MSFIIGMSTYPYFALQNQTNKPGLPKAVLWLTTPPKSHKNKKNKLFNKNHVLVGYYIKKVSKLPNNKPSSDTILFIDNQKSFKIFKDMYSKGTKINWDKVKKDWAGLELGGSYLVNWIPHSVAVWNMDALETTDAPIFIVYTLPGCPYSLDIITTLDKLKIPYLEHSVLHTEKNHYKDLHNWSTFPHVFLVGKDDNLHLIGGCEEFHKFLRSIAS